EKHPEPNGEQCVGEQRVINAQVACDCSAQQAGEQNSSQNSCPRKRVQNGPGNFDASDHKQVLRIPAKTLHGGLGNAWQEELGECRGKEQKRNDESAHASANPNACRHSFPIVIVLVHRLFCWFGVHVSTPLLVLPFATTPERRTSSLPIDTPSKKKEPPASRGNGSKATSFDDSQGPDIDLEVVTTCKQQLCVLRSEREAFVQRGKLEDRVTANHLF